MRITERVFPGKDLEIKLFSIKNRQTGKFLSMHSCSNGSRLNFENDDESQDSLFFFGDRETLHSALCGTAQAVDISGANCARNIIHVWTTHFGSNQRWTFESNGTIKSKKCNAYNLDGSGSELKINTATTDQDRKWDKSNNLELGNCEGGCTRDSDCKDGLYCKTGITTTDTSLPGCFGDPENGVGFCTEVGLVRNITWHGSYGDGNTFIGTEGGSFVDAINNFQMYGNVWKAYKLEDPYKVTGNTHVSFKFQLTKEAEGHAICFDDDDRSETFGGFQKRCIALAGTEFDLWNNNHVHKVVLHKQHEESDTFEAVVDVKIGHFFSRKGSTIKFIGFVQDNDAAPFEGISSFGDITFFEVQPVSTSYDYLISCIVQI